MDTMQDISFRPGRTYSKYKNQIHWNPLYNSVGFYLSVTLANPKPLDIIGRYSWHRAECAFILSFVLNSAYYLITLSNQKPIESSSFFFKVIQKEHHSLASPVSIDDQLGVSSFSYFDPFNQYSLSSETLRGSQVFLIKSLLSCLKVALTVTLNVWH